MTTDEWLACTKPDEMLKAIAAKASARKLKLIACACCRLIWNHIEPWIRAGVEEAERYTEDDRIGGNDSWFQAGFNVFDESGPETHSPAYAAAAAVQGIGVGNPAAGVFHTVTWANRVIQLTAPVGSRLEARRRHQAAAADVVREIIGPLSHPLVLMSDNQLQYYGGPAAAFRCRVTDTARGIAAGIAADLAFDRLPILADALEDAGLDDRVLLDHLRHGTSHVRGCWALDLVLGRA